MKQEYVKPTVTIFEMELPPLLEVSEIITSISDEEAIGEAI